MMIKRAITAHYKLNFQKILVSLVVRTLLSVRKVWDSNTGSVKSHTVLPMARQSPPLRRVFGIALSRRSPRTCAPLLIKRFGVITRA